MRSYADNDKHAVNRHQRGVMTAMNAVSSAASVAKTAGSGSSV